MLLTGHKSRAIFDRYNIIHEQELLDAGDQLVAYLASPTERSLASSVATSLGTPSAIQSCLHLAKEESRPAQGREMCEGEGTAMCGEPSRAHFSSSVITLLMKTWRLDSERTRVSPGGC